MAQLVLASASPQRKMLLESVGLTPHVIHPADIDETPRKKEAAIAYAVRIAVEKARAIRTLYPHDYIIAGDTIAEQGGRIILKADTVDEARITLKSLSGKKHRAITAVCAISPEGKETTKCVESVVTFKRFEHDELEAYLATNGWVGKSGCYGLQSEGGGFVKRINGSYSNIIGLPLVEAKAMLHGLGYRA